MSDPLALLSTTDDATMARLHDRLTTAAAANDTLDIAYHTIDSPIGSLLLTATPRGVLKIAFDNEGHDAVLQRLADDVSPRVLRAPSRLDTVAAQLDEYFAGNRKLFDLNLDLQLAQGFRLDVLDGLRKVPYGARESYGQLASAVGNPKAVRAVGTACARNPIPIVIPCHRVVRSDGSIGQYAGGAIRKQTLLDFEHRAG